MRTDFVAHQCRIRYGRKMIFATLKNLLITKSFTLRWYRDSYFYCEFVPSALSGIVAT
jgi:hypothetical protein